MLNKIITSLLLVSLFFSPVDSFALSTIGNAYISVPNTSSPTNALTIMTWHYSTSTATQWLGVMSTSSGVFSYGIRKQTTSALRFYTKRGSTQTTLDTGANLLVANRWVHVAGVYDGANMITYVNGVRASSTAATGNIVNSGNHPLALGRTLNATTLTCSCSMYDFRVYHRALSDNEIKHYYHTGQASRNQLIHHLPLNGIQITNFANNTRMGTTSGSWTLGRLPFVTRWRR